MTQHKKKTTKPRITKGGKTQQGLNNQQESFCQLYVSPDKEFFGNGVQCYIEVYQPDTTQKNRYKTACSYASQLLSNIKVIGRINELLEEGGLNDQNVDKQLSFLISQYSDFSNKLGAIREYNKLRQRIIDKQETKHTFDLKGKSMVELEELRQSLLNK